MTFDQLTKLKEAESFFLKDVEIVKVGDYVSIDNKLAFPIITSQCFERLNDISLHYEKGLRIGHIKFLKSQSIDDITGLAISVMLTPVSVILTPLAENGSKNRKYDNITLFFLNSLLSIQCGVKYAPSDPKLHRQWFLLRLYDTSLQQAVGLQL